jgi:hypothetical protein
MFRIYSQIMSAIAAGDPALAERRMRQHIGATQARAAVRETTEVPLRSPTTSTPVPTPIRTWSGILIRQMTQDSDVDIVLGKALGVLGQTERGQPLRDRGHLLPSRFPRGAWHNDRRPRSKIYPMPESATHGQSRPTILNAVGGKLAAWSSVVVLASLGRSATIRVSRRGGWFAF